MTETPERDRLLTDRERLRTAAYRDAGNLDARAGLYRYDVDPIDLAAWVFEQAPPPPHATVLDVGCGPGRYLAHLAQHRADVRATGLDLSRGMCTAASAHASVGVADASQLPIRTASIDIVIAAHMLYHVRDVALATREIARVLAPGGRALVVLNDRSHLDAMHELLTHATGQRVDGDRINGANIVDLVADHLTVERVVGRVSEVVVPQAVPVVSYVNSCRATFEPLLSAFNSWTTVLARARQEVLDTIEREGAWRTTTAISLSVFRRRAETPALSGS